ncbi:MAG: pseudouridine synthase [Vulcanimicrobiota bacterium]
MRIQKALAHLGFGSRRGCEQMVAEGRVTLSGQPMEIGQSVDEHQLWDLAVDGKPVGGFPAKRYLLLNKPEGYVTTVADPQGRLTVMDLLPEDSRVGEGRVYPVGRLDRQTLGVLLFTNDGGLAHRLLHPSSGVEKEYLAQVEGSLTPLAMERLKAGPPLDDGPTRPPAKVEVKGKRILLTIKEGRKRQVRRMLQAVGLRCTRLERLRFGGLDSGGLAPGDCRELTPEEVASLEALCRN